MARRVAEHVGAQAQFRAESIQSSTVDGPFDAAYLLDVLHHIPRADQISVIERIADLLAPGGVLIIKDVTTKPWLGLKFTEYLDRVMVGFHEELAYRHHAEWKAILENLGLSVRVVRVPDILPYPHVVIAATKPRAATSSSRSSSAHA
jgi:2-polyprenyl-3-methyl-5-hydroxy-6-metoxy-1,4-benzoquinol methylase